MNILQQNWVTVVFTILLAAITYLAYVLYFKPLALYNYYIKKLSLLNYKTYVHPFKFLSSGYITKIQSDLKNNKDSLYFNKTEYPKNQVTVLNLFNIVALELLDVELIKEYYEKNAEGYYVKGDIGTRAGKRFMNNGILLSQGQKWKIRRKTISSVFNFQFIKQILPTIATLCFQQFQKLQKNNKKNGKCQALIQPIFENIYSQVVVRCFFKSQPFPAEDGRKASQILHQILRDTGVQVISIPGLVFGAKYWKLGITEIDRRMNRNLKLLKDFANKLIKYRVQQIKKQGIKQRKSDIIEALYSKNLLIEQRSSKNQYNPTQYSNEQLIQEFNTFFVAGTDTTANLSTMITYALAKYPRIQQKIRQQINENFPEQISAQMFAYQNLQKLKYLGYVQNQALRMYGPVPLLLNRVATKDHYLGNIPIKQGTYIKVNSLGNHFRQEYFINPFQFNPDRWEKQQKMGEQQNDQNPYRFMSFSAGQRNCIGKHLALLQSKIAIIILLKKYKTIKLKDQDFSMELRGSIYSPKEFVICLQ